VYLYTKKENFESEIPLQKISSMYNNQKIIFNNLEILQEAKINDLSANTIIGNNILANNIQSNQLNSQKITAPLVCLNNKCLSDNTIKTLLFESSRINDYMYLPEQCVLWSNLKPYINNDIKVINTGFDMTNDNEKWPSNDQNGKNIYSTISRGSKEPNDTGIQITIPQPPSGANYDYNVLWVQTLNERWSTFKVFSNNPYTPFGNYAIGYEYLNNISPNGAIHNERWDLFVWYPVPFKMSADRKIMINNYHSGSDTWYSGFAFSTNPWNHCKLSALSIHWQTNKEIESDIDATNPTIVWPLGSIDKNWNNQTLATFKANTEPEFKIPFVNSGNDKIFYIIEHNNVWGPGIINVSIQNIDKTNYTSLGSLHDSFNNPFARHSNSVMYQRYLGVVIPKNLLPTDINFITIKLSIPYNNDGLQIQKNVLFGIMLIASGQNGLHFSEVGTHDYNSF